jgi:hypothetical protein
MTDHSPPLAPTAPAIHRDEMRDLIIARLRELGRFGTLLDDVAKIPLDPSPDDLLKIRDDLEALVRKVDPVIEAYGDYLAVHATCNVDLSAFRNLLDSALREGGAFGEIEEAAQVLREDLEESGRSDFEEHNTHDPAHGV